MIYSVSCDKATFKTINFKPGLNVILAEKSEKSGPKETRNGLGKSTLIEIIHFCLGGEKGETLSDPHLDGWTFNLDLELSGRRYVVSRNTFDSKKVYIVGDCSGWEIKPTKLKDSDKQFLKNEDWKSVLGALMFALPITFEEDKYNPSFRSLVSYFVRRRQTTEGSFLSPFKQCSEQANWDLQVNNLFLLGLNWSFARQFQLIKDKQKFYDQLKKSLSQGFFSDLIGDDAELQAIKVNLQEQVNKEKDELASFKIHPQYKHLEDESNALTKKIHELVDLCTLSKMNVDQYESSLKVEAGANPEAIIAAYEEAKIVMPEVVKRELKDVLDFNKKLIENRSRFLEIEINGLKKKIEDFDFKIKGLTDKRAEIMYTLQTHKALDEYTSITALHNDNVAKLNEIETKLANWRKIKSGSRDLIIELQTLKQKADLSLMEQSEKKDKAISLFNSNSKALYDASGLLTIGVADSGYTFDVKIERSTSSGITLMKIFCYDLMLMELWADRKESPRFLLHDSTIFEGVDSRQIASSIELAAKKATEKGIQYICLLNSDLVPLSYFSPEFKFDSFVRLKLFDSSEQGGLLGIRF
ncbi:MAG: DUF2326 domain-containing protein [archaeon]|jgi:uncharacterized protein YydD (DUF2326 family)